jgi:hypothetical protein
VRRLIFGSVVTALALSITTFTAPNAGSTLAGQSKRHSNAATCARLVKGHTKVTRSEISICKTSTLPIGRPCLKGSTVITVTVKSVFYALVPGHKPVSLGKEPGIGTLTRVCGSPKTSSTPSTSAPVGTTTSPPPLTTTTVKPPPSTTAPVITAPATCTPISDEGGCYEPGEYCRDDDHGLVGRAGDGETITCEDNNGWRWEPT